MPKQPEEPIRNDDGSEREDPLGPGDAAAGPPDNGDSLSIEPLADNPDVDVSVDAESLQTQLEESKERALRLQAELENFRKRAQRTLEEERRYACLPLLRDLLPVVDNLQRAIDAAQQNDGTAGLLEGVEIVAGQLSTILKQHHCEAIPAEGERFDPHLHEAIAQFPSEEFEPGNITQVTQVGYQLYDRVIRPAQVIIAAPRPDSD